MSSGVPKVSILMIAYNRAPFLRDAIESVLAQSFSDWELILIDDGSTDHTEEMIPPYLTDARIRYIRHAQNIGIVSSRNEALAISKGEYIAILDSDDVWSDPQKLETQLAFLEHHPDYTVVGCATVDVIDEHGQVVDHVSYPETDRAIRKRCLARNPFTHSSVLYRKDIALAYGGYKEYAVGEDYDLLLHLGTQGKMYNLMTTRVAYRKHVTNISVQKRKDALRLNIRIMHAYKTRYPRFFFAFVRRYVRYIVGMVCLTEL